MVVMACTSFMWVVVTAYLHVDYVVMTVDATSKPLIGVLSLPCSDNSGVCAPAQVDFNATSMIGASYVRWIESGGGRVVPLLADADHEYIKKLLPKLNGVLFTGGSAEFNISVSFYYSQVINIIDYLRKYNKESGETEAIPLWTTCLGFEALLTAVAKGGTSIRFGTNADDYATRINFTNGTLTNSQMFGEYGYMDESYANDVYYKFSKYNISENLHSYGIRPDTLYTDEYLSTNFSVLGTSRDRNNSQFVTLIESQTQLGLYWFGSQFHPERPSWEFNGEQEYSDSIPHSLDAIISNQYLSQFFVNQCRMQNNNSMTHEEYVKKVIYRFDSYYINENNTVATELVYVFPNASQVYYDYYQDEDEYQDEYNNWLAINLADNNDNNDNGDGDGDDVQLKFDILVVIIGLLIGLVYIFCCRLGYCMKRSPKTFVSDGNVMVETSPLVIKF